MNGFRGPLESSDGLVLLAALRSSAFRLLSDGRDPVCADIQLLIDLLEEIIPDQAYFVGHTVRARSLARQENPLAALNEIEPLLNICGARQTYPAVLDVPLACWRN